MIHDAESLRTRTDHRYWRRRVNRRVRKARRMRTLWRWTGVILLNLAVLALMLFSAIRTLRHLTTSPEFSLRTIQINGTERSDAAALRERLAGLSGSNLLDLDLQEIAARVRLGSWVSDCTVKRILPDTLRINVTEREPSAVLWIGDVLHVVDRTGVVVGPARADLEGSLPTLTGLERVRRSSRGAALFRGVEALERLRLNHAVWAASVTEIDSSRNDRIAVRTVDGGPQFLLDPDRVDRNLGDYLALRREIENRMGPATYVDLRWANRIAVMPEDDQQTDPRTQQENM